MRSYRYSVLILFILLATATRLYRISAQSIWFDEGWSAYAAVQPTLLAAVEADPTNPPLYYLVLNITARGFGDSPFGLRVASLLMGLLTIPLAYQLARRLFDARAGLYAAFLVSVSAPLWWASQEARMYTLLALLVLIAALAWHRLVTRSGWQAWLSLLTAETLLLYAHNTGPVIVLWLNGVTLLVWLVRRSRHRPDWRLWFGVQVVVGVLWLPWYATRFIHVQAANSVIDSGPQLGFVLFSRIAQALWTAPWEMIGHEPVLTGFALAAGLIALATVPWGRVEARWLIAHTALLISGLIAGLTLIGNEMHGRYLVMILPLLLAAVGAGMARLRLPLLRYGTAGVFAAMLLVNMSLAQNPLYQHDDARAMVQHYADTLTAEDTVLAWSYADRFDLAYYWGRLGVPARRVTLPEGADWEQVAPLLPDTGRVSLNIWYTQRADFRGMLSCALGHGTINLPAEFTTYGMTSLLYESPARNLPQMRPVGRPVLRSGVPFVRVTAAGELPVMTADRALCVPVELRVEQPLAVDLRAAVLVRTSAGWDIAQESSIFATANQRTTTAVAPGETVMAFILLRLPYGAPPGDYEVLLRVFDDRDEPSGYDMADEDGRILGKELSLGIWHIEPGADWFQVRRDTHLPHRVDLAVGDDMTLLAHNIEPDMTVRPGHEWRVELLWQGVEQLPDLLLMAQDAGWQVRVPAESGPRDPITLDWRTVLVPGSAPGGTADLYLDGETWLGTFRIDVLPRMDDPPEYAVSVDMAVGEIGTLVGYTPADETADRTQPFVVTLVWQAGDVPAEISYTVFVQLLDAQGRLIAQSDSIPAQGDRPTTGWRAQEYIIDVHPLRFNDLAAPGEARLIAGMYDALTGQRLVIGPDGADFIELPGVIRVR